MNSALFHEDHLEPLSARIGIKARHRHACFDYNPVLSDTL